MIGTLTLVRLALRRGRVLLPVWIVVIAGVIAVSASAIAELYPQAGQRIALGVTIGSAPALQALTGPVFDASSVGGLTAWRTITMASVLAALMSILVVIRHTRAEEESGRAELIGACAVGRHALSASAVLIAGGANLLIALLIALGLAGEGLPVSGALPWAALGVFALLGQLGELLQLDDWITSLSPFAYVPRILGASVNVSPLTGLVAVTVALAGVAAFRRRDLQGG